MEDLQIETQPAVEDDRKEHAIPAPEMRLINEIESAIRDLNNQKQGALMLIVRSAGLTGVWNLDLANAKLVKQETT